MEKTIELNGMKKEIPTTVHNVQELIVHLNLSDRILIVEQNQEILSKENYDKPIQDRDQIEIIHFVGGG